MSDLGQNVRFRTLSFTLRVRSGLFKSLESRYLTSIAGSGSSVLVETENPTVGVTCENQVCRNISPRPIVFR